MPEIVINDETKPSLKDYDLEAIGAQIIQTYISPLFQLSWLKKIVVMALEKIADAVPEEVMKYIALVSDGTTPAELDQLGSELSELLNLKIDLKGVPDFLEPMIFNTIVTALLTLAKSGYSMPLKQV